MVIAIRAGDKAIVPASATLSLSGVSDQTDLAISIPADLVAPADLTAPIIATYHGEDFHRWSVVDATISSSGGAAAYVSAKFALGPQRGGTLWGSSIAMLRSLRTMTLLEQRIRPLLRFQISAEDDEIILSQTSHIARYIFLAAGAGDSGINALLRLRDSRGSQTQRDLDLAPLRRAMSATLQSTRTYGDALASLYSDWGIICRPVYDWGDGDELNVPDLPPLAFSHALDDVPEAAPQLAAVAVSRPFIDRLREPIAVVSPFRYSSSRRCAPVPAGYVYGTSFIPISTADGETLHNVYTGPTPTAAGMATQILRPGQPRTAPGVVKSSGAILLEAVAPDLWTAWAESERAQWQRLLPHRECTATVLGPATIAEVAHFLPGTAIRIDGRGYWIASARLEDTPPRYRAQLDLVAPL